MVAHRTDEGGTAAVFTEHLAKVIPKSALQDKATFAPREKTKQRTGLDPHFVLIGDFVLIDVLQTQCE